MTQFFTLPWSSCQTENPCELLVVAVLYFHVEGKLIPYNNKNLLEFITSRMENRDMLTI